MKTKNKDEISLKLHADNEGNVWYISGDLSPINSKMGWDDFMKSREYQRARYFRLIGSSNNAVKICDLYQRKLNGKLAGVEVCSPMVCQTVKERSDPETALFNMRNWNWAASLGGWHDVTQNDYVNYKLVLNLNTQDQLSEETLTLAKQHPAWKGLSFITHLNVINLIILLALIIDPRWYIDFDDPSSGAKLKAFLGLTPKIQSLAGSNKLHANRYKLVLDTWKTANIEPPNIHHPSNFLWRVWLAHGKDKTGDLRTSQVFISFLRNLWLSRVQVNEHVSKELFIPKYFFKHEDEALAFEHFMNK